MKLNSKRLRKTARRMEERDRQDMEENYLDSFTEWDIADRQGKIQRDFARFLTIIEDMNKCHVNKTCDTSELVVCFEDSVGNQASLWLTAGNEIRTITPY